MRLSLPASVIGFVLLASPLHLDAQTDPNAADEVVFDLEFQGGTLRRYIDELRVAIDSSGRGKGAGVNVSVSDPEAADRVLLPPLSMKNVSARTALDIVEVTAKSDDFAARSVRLGKAGQAEAPVYFVQLKPLSRKEGESKAGAPSSRVEVFSLREAFESGQSPQDEMRLAETFLSAVKAGLEIASEERKSPQARLHFHPESRLLFVVGDEDDITLTAQVLSQLISKKARDAGANRRDGAESARRSAQRDQGDDSALREEVVELRRRLVEIEKAIAGLSRNADARGPADGGSN